MFKVLDIGACKYQYKKRYIEENLSEICEGVD